MPVAIQRLTGRPRARAHRLLEQRRAVLEFAEQTRHGRRARTLNHGGEHANRDDGDRRVLGRRAPELGDHVCEAMCEQNKSEALNSKESETCE